MYTSGDSLYPFSNNKGDKSEAKLLSILVGFRIYLVECNICSGFIKGPVNSHGIEA